MTSDFNIAVHALVYLSHKAQTLSSEALAENICTNPARVRKVLSALGKAGLIQTREGRPHGGYAIARPAGEITLGEVSRAMDARFVSTAWRSGDPSMTCLVASGMADIMDGIYERLDAQCKQYLEHITIRDLERHIFRPAPDKSAQSAAERTSI